MDFAPLIAWMQTIASALPVWLVYPAACVGHGFWMIVGINVFYSYPIPHRILKLTRRLDLVFIFAGPFLFAYALDLFETARLVWEPGTGRFYLAPYTAFCAFIGLVVAPLCELRYLLRRPAPQLVEESKVHLDVAGHLGYSPIGRGKHSAKCLLPWNEVFQVEFNAKTFVLPNLPAALDGTTILHLTDLHFCGSPDREFYRVVVRKCLEWGTPDLIALTGDVVDSDWHHRWILPILGRLEWKSGAFAILGNHDKIHQPEQVRRRLRRARFDVLGNGWKTALVRGESVAVIGHEGPWFGRAPNLEGCPREIFKVCLSHTPDHLPWARKHGIDLVLAGHVHGGQIRLPFLGSVFVPSRFSRHYDCGTFFEAPTLMHVSRGLAGQHPLHFFCKPEVTWITLRKFSPLSPPGRGENCQPEA